MLTSIEGPDVTALRLQFRELVAALLEAVAVAPATLEVDATREGNFRGYDGTLFYLVQRGSLTVRYQDKTIYTLEEGDILLPDIAGAIDDGAAVVYGSDTGALLQSYPALDFMQRVFDDPTAIRLWTRLMVSYAGLMLRIAAAYTLQGLPATPGFEEYAPGDIIIRQGEPADYVYHMNSGVAEVLVDGVQVGSIGEDEIFGAMATLTQADRSATVKARTRCSIVKVPKEQFTDLIRSNPATIHSLLVDMAHSIVNLNEQLVGYRDRYPLR